MEHRRGEMTFAQESENKFGITPYEKWSTIQNKNHSNITTNLA